VASAPPPPDTPLLAPALEPEVPAPLVPAPRGVPACPPSELTGEEPAAPDEDEPLLPAI
jgi:hypothetical protein